MLLALLLLRANKVVLRDTLTEELSGGAASEAAANALQAGISRLRKSLVPDVISSSSLRRRGARSSRPGGQSARQRRFARR